MNDTNPFAVKSALNRLGYVGLVTFALVLGFVAPSGLTSAALADDASLTLTVSGLDPQEGQIAIAIFVDEASYKSGENPVANAMVPVDGAVITTTFDGLASGPCAIKIFHDVNGNGELDTNMLGMPTEPYGFSNGAKGRFGPPGFDAARFELTAGDNEHEIELETAG